MITIKRKDGITILQDKINSYYQTIETPVTYTIDNGKLVIDLPIEKGYFSVPLYKIKLESGVKLEILSIPQIKAELDAVLPSVNIVNGEFVTVQEFKAGSTFTIVDSSAKKIVVYVSTTANNPVIKLPAIPVEFQEILLFFHVTTNPFPVSIVPNTGYTIQLPTDAINPITSVGKGECVTFYYDPSTSKMVQAVMAGSQTVEFLASKGVTV